MSDGRIYVLTMDDKTVNAKDEAILDSKYKDSWCELNVPQCPSKLELDMISNIIQDSFIIIYDNITEKYKDIINIYQTITNTEDNLMLAD